MIVGRIAAAATLALFLVTVCCGGATALTWFEDNFDSYSNGALDGKGGWSGGGSSVRVQTDYVHSGKSVKMDYLSWGGGECRHNITTDGGNYFLTVDLAMDTLSVALGENLGYVKIYNSADVEVTRIYLAHQRLKALISPANVVTIADNTEMRTWYNVRIAVRPSTNRMDVWVDGDLKISNQLTHGSPSDCARVVVAQWTNLGTKFTKSETYVDNVLVESPAESAIKILSPTTGWETANVMFPFAMYDDAAGKYRMWYTGSGFAQWSDSNWDVWNIGIASSENGVTWARRTYEYEPVVYCHKFWVGDVVQPARVSDIFDYVFAFGGCVIRDGAEYKMWYTGWSGASEHIGGGVTRKLDYRIGYATSEDGVEWTKHEGAAGHRSVLGLGGAGALDARGAAQPSVLKEGSDYRMWYEGFDGSEWRILYATSSDGMNWIKQGAALSPGGSGSPDQMGVRNPIVVTRNGQYEMWYTGQSAASPYYHCMRATSSDGLTWTKVPGEVILHPDDALDGKENLYVDSVIVNPDNTCRVFFSKENATPSNYTYGTITTKRTYIYTEGVNP